MNNNEKAVLNTTINKGVLNDFKAYCNELGLPMNVIVESFMYQFTNGEFTLKIGQNNRLNVDLLNEGN